MSSALVQKLTGVRDLKKILETTVKDLGETFRAETFQVMLTNPLDPNVTSICEFRASKEEPPEMLPTITMPLVLHGRTLGAVSMARYGEISADEVNAMRVILGELGDIIRGAQINDIVQRDTFRETFLVEIGNVMAYSLGIGDALFMVVNILGKVLQASRCLFICTDDTQAGWKCYEYWQQEKVQSCQEYRWPTSDSSVIAQVLLSAAPMSVYEGQTNSYISPVQEELQFISVKSLLGVPLRSEDATHGCVILQQCDYRRAWTRGEIDMVQNVADKVADALVKLPAEKRAREPIMQLHQRIVTQPAEQGKAPDAVAVRNALKGTFGQQPIQSARKTSAPPPPPKIAPTPPQPPSPALAHGAAPTPVAGAQSQPIAHNPSSQWPMKTDVETQIKMPTTSNPPVRPTADLPAASATSPFVDGATMPPANYAKEQPTISPVQSRSSQNNLPNVPGAQRLDANGDPYANLDFGDVDTATPTTAAAKAAAAAHAAGHGARIPGPDDTWGTLDAIPPGAVIPGMRPGTTEGAAAQAVPLQPGAAPGIAASAATAGAAVPTAGGWGSLDAIPTPKAPSTTAGAWGDLDSIGGPGGASQVGAPPPEQRKSGGLTSMMAGKARANNANKPFSKSRGVAAPPDGGNGGAGSGAEVVPITEAVAQERVRVALSKQSSDELSDYVFASPGLDPRMAGRVSSWIQEIEVKDRYVAGHAKQVAEICVAIAREAGLNQQDCDMVRLAGLLHDVGKRACPPEVLRKKDEDLTDPELIIMMKHPIDGAELLESFAELKAVAEIVRAHHEEFDGNGYPQGLKGKDIPIAARIVGLANSYHSMISEMTYGPGMSPQKAQEDLVKGAGKQWDPTFVQALIQAIMSRKLPGLS